MSGKRTRKNKSSARHDFLYTWAPSDRGVKGELKSSNINKAIKLSSSKKADILAQDTKAVAIKRDVLRSLVLISFLIALELMIYLAWNRFR